MVCLQKSRAALHYHLLNRPLGDFTTGSMQPMTEAKKELIHLSLDGPSRFVLAFENGEIEGFPAKNSPALLLPCTSMDFYELYVEWGRRNGMRAAPSSKLISVIKRKHKGETARKRMGDSGSHSTIL